MLECPFIVILFQTRKNDDGLTKFSLMRIDEDMEQNKRKLEGHDFISQASTLLDLPLAKVSGSVLRLEFGKINFVRAYEHLRGRT